MDKITTYVYDGHEVQLTGRRAVRRIKSAMGKDERHLILVEIAPVDQSFEWKKWVSKDQLYEIIEKEQ